MAEHDHEPTAADRRWLAATWPWVREHLPPPPCRVLDVGCGPLGGFVPSLLREGYDAAGIDPEAPDGPHYGRITFEEYNSTDFAAAIVASTSLHHVDDLDAVIGLMERRLDHGGVLIVVEWARERFDEATAQWCFDRLPVEPGWLHRCRDEWLASEQSWTDYLDHRVTTERMHAGQDILKGLAARFVSQLVTEGPYFFCDLGISADEEQAAIDAGEIQANGIRYVGTRKRNNTGEEVSPNRSSV